MIVNWKFAERAVCRVPSRVNVIALSFAIGVFSIVATTIASDLDPRALDKSINAPVGGTRLEIVAPLEKGFDEKLVSGLRELTEIQTVTPLVKRNTILYTGQQKNRFVALGIDPDREREKGECEIAAGNMLSSKEGGIMLDETFAKNAGIKVNDRLQFLTRRGVINTKVVGLYKSPSFGTNADVPTLIMPIAAAQHFFDSQGTIDSAQIVLKPEADKKTALAAIQKILPAGVVIRDAAPNQSNGPAKKPVRRVENAK